MQSVLIYSVNSSHAELYKKALGKLNLKISHAETYSDFEKYLLDESYSLVILDLELDNTDAITVMKEMKLLKLEHQPLIVVCSTKADDFIQVSAFNSGADDFIDLPINILVFEPKIKALLKRTENIAFEGKNGFIHIDHERYKIIIGNHAHTLPRLEFRMVTLLFSNPNKIFSKDEIATEIWHNKEISSKRTIDIHIRNIRRELGEDIIKTYRGLGYCLKVS